MQNTINLTQIQNYILAFESIFFKDDKIPVDCQRVDVTSERYDCKYEEDVRRPDVNLILLLQEMLNDKKYRLDIVCMLYSLENKIVSSQLYRKLIFRGDVTVLRDQYKDFLETFRQSVALFKKSVTPQQYIKIAVGYQHLSPPESKEEFLKRLLLLEHFLKSREDIFYGSGEGLLERVSNC